MKSRLFRPVRAAGVSAAVAHALAWVAFLWIVVGSCVYHCAFFFDRNGLWFFTAMFFPVILTGLALITLLTWKGPRLGTTLVLGGLATVLLAFCVMGYLSYGIVYLPAALALITAAIIFGVRTGVGKEGKQGE